jgi:hypothetical protein
MSNKFTKFFARLTPLTVGLLILLGVVATGGAVHAARVHYLEEALIAEAHDIVEQINAEDPLPVPEEGPEANVEFEATCAFKYLVVGEKSGKVSMIVKPRPHAPVQETYVICYTFDYGANGWVQTGSYHEH